MYNQIIAKNEIRTIISAQLNWFNCDEWFPTGGDAPDDTWELPSVPAVASGLTAVAGGTPVGLIGKVLESTRS